MAMHRHKHRHRHKQMQIQGSWASAYTIGVSYIVLASSPGLVASLVRPAANLTRAATSRTRSNEPPPAGCFLSTGLDSLRAHIPGFAWKTLVSGDSCPRVRCIAPVSGALLRQGSPAFDSFRVASARVRDSVFW